MRRIVVRWSIVFGIVLAFSALGYAQQEAIHGTVTDATGKPLPGVTVKATNTATGEVAQDITDKDGLYRISLRTGNFSVTSTLAGFGNASQTVDILTADQPEVNFKMTAGGETQATVTAAAPATAGTGGNVTNQQVENLPSNGRNQIDLTLQAPRSDQNAVVNDVFVAYNSGNGGAFQILMDGQQLTTIIAQGFGQAHFSKDAVEQLQMGDRFDATNGRSTKLIAQEVTKSGTNQFLGRASGYFRNDFLNSPDFMTINPTTGNYVTLPYQDQQLSFTFGGPIIKNKLHFFANYEYERNPQTYPYSSPFNGQTNNGQTLPNIPDLNQNVTSPRSLSTYGGRVDWQLKGQDHLMVRAGNYKEVAPLDYTEYNGTAYGPASATGITKLDHQYYGVYTKVLSSKSVNALRAGDAYFQWDEPSLPLVNNTFSSYGSTANTANNGAWYPGYLAAGTQGDMRLNMGEPSLTLSVGSQPTTCTTATAVAANPLCGGVVTPAGVTAASAANGYHFGQEHVGSPELLGQSVWTVRDDFTHTMDWHGGHTLKVGGEWLHMDSWEVFSSGNGGSGTISVPWALGPSLPYYFTNVAGNTASATPATTGPTPPTAAMIAAGNVANGNTSGIYTPQTWDLGGLSSYATTETLGIFGPLPKYWMLRQYYDGYAQDDWQIKPMLTINFGLRYDIATNLFAEAEAVPGIKNAGQPIAKNGLGPRIGFTYKITNTTIVRGGFGKYFADCGEQTCGNAGARTAEGPAGASLTFSTTNQNKNLPAGLYGSTGAYSGTGAAPNNGLQTPEDLVTFFQSTPQLEGYPVSGATLIPGATGGAVYPVGFGITPNGAGSTVLSNFCAYNNASGTFSINAPGNLNCSRPGLPSLGEVGGYGWSDNANIGIQHIAGNWIFNSDFYFEGGRHIQGSSASNILWNPDGTNAPYVAYAPGTTTPYNQTGPQAALAAVNRPYPNYTTGSFEQTDTISNYLGVTTTVTRRVGALTGTLTWTWSEVKDATESEYGCEVGVPCVNYGTLTAGNVLPSGGTTDGIGLLPHLSNTVNGSGKPFPGFEGLNDYTFGVTDQRNRANFNFLYKLPHGFSISGLYFFGSGQALAQTFTPTTSPQNTNGVVDDGGGSTLLIPTTSFANPLPYNQNVVVINGSIRTDGGISAAGATPGAPGTATGMPMSSLCAIASIPGNTTENPGWNPACVLQRDGFHPKQIDRVDARLTKTIKMGERVNTDVFIEAFNLFNHENFGTWNTAVNTTSGAGAYGLPAYNFALPFQARMAQFGFKIDFKL